MKHIKGKHEKDISAREESSVDHDKTIIQVSRVPRAQEPLLEIPYYEAVEALINQPKINFPEGADKKFYQKVIKQIKAKSAGQQRKRVEACSKYRGDLLADVAFHPVIAAIHLAYSEHRPLCLSPDHFWLMICQGLANHVNQNAETLRSQFVHHSEKAKIEIRRDDFIKGSADNPWDEVLEDMSAAIRVHIGDKTHDYLRPAFSTTGMVEQAAAEIVFLDAMQSYFKYELYSRCGIPEVKLEGTVKDWQTLLNRTHDLTQFGLAWWTQSLIPILRKIVESVQGKPDQLFWKSIYKQDAQSSGGPYALGWITAFFPYLKNRETGMATIQNEFLLPSSRGQQEVLYPVRPWSVSRVFNELKKDLFMIGLTTERFPSSLSKAPFTWNYIDLTFDMEFLGGFVGVFQDSRDLTLRPEIGWAVRESDS